MIARIRPHGAAGDLRALLAASEVMVEPADVGDALQSLALPCLIYGGELDPAFAGGQACAGLMPKARFVSLPGLGHMAAFLRADLALPIIREFLAEVGASR